MARRPMTPEVHRRLLEAFRGDEEPGSFASFRRVAVLVGVNARTSRRAYRVGWPGVKPICAVIEGERQLARAALRREVLAARLDEASRLAAEDAIEVRMTEGRSVRAVMTSATNSLVALHQEKIHEYQRTLARLMQDTENPGSKVALAARRTFADTASTIARLAEAAATAQRMEKLVLGEATSIVAGSLELRPVVSPAAGPAELAAEIQAAQRALDEARQLEEAQAEVEERANGGGDSALPS